MERLPYQLALARGDRRRPAPTWTPLAEALRDRFGWPIVYDCMDDHAGFLQKWRAEVMVTERPAYRRGRPGRRQAPRRLLRGRQARSRSAAADPERLANTRHFCRERRPAALARTHPTIGYYGAIAEWFDSRLVAKLAALKAGVAGSR